MKSTAKKGNPTQASRGAAVDRARMDLGNAIDVRLAIDVEAMELALLAKTIGVDEPDIRGRLDSATLQELTAWMRAVESGEPLLVPASEQSLFAESTEGTTR